MLRDALFEALLGMRPQDAPRIPRARLHGGRLRRGIQDARR